MINLFTYRQSNKYITLLALLLLFSTTLIAQTKTQSGGWSVSQSLPNYSLDSNNGERTMTLEIKFKESFKQKPNIFLSVIQIDAEDKTNVRYNVEAISISRDGFTLIVKTWADSKIFSISGNYLAYTN